MSIDKIRQDFVKEALAELLLTPTEAKKLTDISNLDLEKIKGAKNAYRIRIGNFRVCFYLENDTLKMARVLNRKEVYKNFPRLIFYRGLCLHSPTYLIRKGL